MTPEQFKAEMAKIFSDPNDTESCHEEADELMCKLLVTLGYSEGVRIFQDAGKWYA